MEIQAVLKAIGIGLAAVAPILFALWLAFGWREQYKWEEMGFEEDDDMR